MIHFQTQDKSFAFPVFSVELIKILAGSGEVEKAKENYEEYRRRGFEKLDWFETRLEHYIAKTDVLAHSEKLVEANNRYPPIAPHLAFDEAAADL